MQILYFSLVPKTGAGQSTAQQLDDWRQIKDCISAGTSSAADAQASRTTWDGNQDNNLTKSELSESLAALEKNIKEGKINKSYAVNEMHDESADIDDRSLLDKMSSSLSFGRQLLDNFEAVAKMDGKNDGISRADLTKLAASYKNDNFISWGDFDVAKRGVIA